MHQIRKYQNAGVMPLNTYGTNYQNIQSLYDNNAFNTNNNIGKFTSLSNPTNYSVNKLPPFKLSEQGNYLWKDSSGLEGIFRRSMPDKYQYLFENPRTIPSLSQRYPLLSQMSNSSIVPDTQVVTKSDTPSTATTTTAAEQSGTPSVDANTANTANAADAANTGTATRSGEQSGATDNSIQTGGSRATESTKGNFNNISSGLQGLTGLTGSIGAAFNTKLDRGVLETRNQITNAISKMGPVGAIIGAAAGVTDMIGDIGGFGMETVDKSLAKRAGFNDTNWLNSVIGAAPGAGTIVGGFNKLFGGGTSQGNKSYLLDDMRGGYSGSSRDIDASYDLGNKNLVFGQKKANQFIRESNQKNAVLDQLAKTTNLRKSSTYGQELASQIQNRYTGQSSIGTALGKKGMKLSNVEDARRILEKIKAPVKLDENIIAMFQAGGKMNVIAQGAYHSRKNSLGQVNDNLLDVTKKGIPVVSVEEGGKVTQLAEIEGGELILTKTLTEQIETLYRDGSEEAMIQAGKLLAEEIVTNTDDKTNKIIEDNEDINQ